MPTLLSFHPQYWDILDKLPRTYNLMFPTYKILQRITHEFPAKFYKEFNFYRSDVMNIGKQYANEVIMNFCLLKYTGNTSNKKWVYVILITFH